MVESAADGQPTAPVGPRLGRPLSGVTLAGRGILMRRTPYGPPAAQPRWLGGEPAPIDAWTRRAGVAEPRERLPPRCPPVRRGGPRRLAPASAGSAPDLWVRAPRTPPPAPSGGAAPFSRSSAPLERRPHHRRATANFPSRRMPGRRGRPGRAKRGQAHCTGRALFFLRGGQTPPGFCTLAAKPRTPGRRRSIILKFGPRQDAIFRNKRVRGALFLKEIRPDSAFPWP